MSISTIQEKLFNKGCGSVLIVVAAVAMGVSMFTSQCNSAQRMNGRAGETGAPVAYVDDIPVTAQTIQAQAEAFGGSGQDPLRQGFGLAMATGQTIDSAAIHALFAKGKDVGSSEIEKAAIALVDGELEQKKAELIGKGQLKPGATPAEIDAALKPVTGGRSVEQIRKDAVKTFQTQFANAATKSQVVDVLGRSILAARLGEGAVGSDQDLRDSYKIYVVKRIFFGAQSGSKETPEARAAKAETDLKAGTSFDKLMDTVSNDPPQAGKTVHDTLERVPAEVLDSRPELATLKGKSAGAMTTVVDVPGGKAIYRLDSVLDNAPADFEKNKAKLRAEKAGMVGQQKLQQAVHDIVAKSVRWESPGFHALSAVVDAQRDPLQMTKAMELAQAAAKNENATEKRLGVFALLIATMPQPGAPDPTKNAARLSALEAAQSIGLEDPTLSLELVDLYATAKDGAKATVALVAASKANQKYDADGEKVFRDIATKVRKLQDSKVLTADQAKEVLAQQVVWTAARASNLQSSAAAKSNALTGDKANEAEIARQKAEAAKASGAKPTGSAGPTAPSDADKANEAEIARQKAAAKGNGK